MKLIHVVGARPNFMKVAPVISALQKYSGIAQTLLHTGQHYDANMSDIFFRQLGLPEPDINLGVGSDTQARQTARIMMRFEEVVLQEQPDWVLVYGDVNSTVAAALVCAKLQIPVAHIEAGLRSMDRSMPEEINRLVTDRISNLLFTPSEDGDEHLLQEGIPSDRIHRVGNVMIDTLIRLLPTARAKQDVLRQQLGVNTPYGLVTLHRPSNVDDGEMLSRILAALKNISQSIPLLFPIHPRTVQRMQAMGLSVSSPTLHLIEPLGYLEFLALMDAATLVITDSGGIQEETTYLGVPCLTVRENTERPITVTMGTNLLVGRDMQRLQLEAERVLAGKAKHGEIPPLWDGLAGERIADILSKV